jgi:hypothetical protein
MAASRRHTRDSIDPVALVDLGKQLAQQAIGDSVKKALDANAGAPEPSSPEGIGATILAEVRAMQNALKDDAELAVFAQSGMEMLRVTEIYAPTPFVVVLIGLDGGRNLTRVITRADGVHLTCKVMKVQPGAPPVRVAFREPKK